MKSIWKLSVTVGALIPTDSLTTASHALLTNYNVASQGSIKTPVKLKLRRFLLNCQRRKFEAVSIVTVAGVWACLPEIKCCHSALICLRGADATTNQAAARHHRRPAAARWTWIPIDISASPQPRQIWIACVPESMRVNVQSHSGESEPRTWQKQSLFLNVWQFEEMLHRFSWTPVW